MSRKCEPGCTCRRHFRAKAGVTTNVYELSVAQIAWLAGLLEGEGSFYSGRKKHGGGRERPRGLPEIVVAMADRDIIERAALLFGDQPVHVLRPRPTDRVPNPKTIYRTYLLGWRAVKLMEVLRPLMGERRGAKIDVLLKEYSESPGR